MRTAPRFRKPTKKGRRTGAIERRARRSGAHSEDSTTQSCKDAEGNEFEDFARSGSRKSKPQYDKPSAMDAQRM